MRPLSLVVVLAAASRALALIIGPSLQSLRGRRVVARAGSPFDGLTDALKGAFANDETLPSESKAAAPSASTDVAAAIDGEWQIELRLVGVPQKDASSDLFGPRMRITDKERGLSAQEVVCRVVLSGGAAEIVDASEPLFTEERGQYRYDAGLLKMRLFSAGFTRTFTTTGSLQSIFGGESTSRTSSVYSIPPGPLLLSGEAEKLPSTGECFVRKGKVFCVEPTGLFGTATKNSPAGTFTATTAPLGRRED